MRIKSLFRYIFTDLLRKIAQTRDHPHEFDSPMPTLHPVLYPVLEEEVRIGDPLSLAYDGPLDVIIKNIRTGDLRRVISFSADGRVNAEPSCFGTTSSHWRRGDDVFIAFGGVVVED